MSSNPIFIAAMLGLLAAPAYADDHGDPDKGEKVYRKCKSCHDVGEDAKNKTGPILNNVMNAPAAHDPDFKYSDAMLQAREDGLVWDEETLSAYLRKPKDVVPKTKMTFAGLRKDDDIADILAYLAQFTPETEEGEAAEAPASN